MPRAGGLSDFECGIIVGLHLGEKHTYQKIAAIVKRSKGAIQGVIERYMDEGRITTIQRSGRPTKLSKRDEQLLERRSNH